MDLAQLVVFVRPPAEGLVKTRLSEELGCAGAASLYRAFVEDVLTLCERVREIGRIEVALWASELEDPAVSDWGRRLGATPRLQPTGDLGARMTAAFGEGHKRYERVVIIGSDVPTLPLRLVVDAFDALDRSSIVLGPSNDGGYYAIGATKAARPRFEGVRWSTPSALSDTLEANPGVRASLLSPWYDVDDSQDLAILRAHLSTSPKAAPATARCLAELAAHR
jgi:rSAM/selenodomain-associated transferase 1